MKLYFDLSKGISIDESLEKSLDKTKLVQREIVVQTRHGVVRRKQWVKAGEDEKKGKPAKHEVTPNNNKAFYVNKSAVSLDIEPVYFPLANCGNPNAKPMKLAQLNQALLIHYNKHKDKYKCSYGEFRNGPLAEKFVKEHFFISDGTTQTEQMYKVNGKYTPERMKLHKAIVQQIVDSATKPPAGKKPIAILMGGGSASGKGTVRKGAVLPALSALGATPGICDSDDIKESMPEYSTFKDQSKASAAWRAHEESSDICNEAIDALVKEGKNLLFDGTMKNYAKYMGVIDKLHKAGYEVRIVGVDVPLNEAIVRSDKRAEHTGRTVPHSIIQGSHGGFSLTLPKLIDKVDSYVLYDNSGEGGATLMASSDTGVVNQGAYDTFIKKGTDYAGLKNLANKFNVKMDVLSDLFNNGASLEELEEYGDSGFDFNDLKPERMN